GRCRLKRSWPQSSSTVGSLQGPAAAAAAANTAGAAPATPAAAADTAAASTTAAAATKQGASTLLLRFAAPLWQLALLLPARQQQRRGSSSRCSSSSNGSSSSSKMASKRGEVSVLMVAEKPSIAETLADILSKKNCSKRRGISPVTSVWEFRGEFLGQPAFFKVTSTAGHIYQTEFPPAFNDWVSRSSSSTSSSSKSCC
ncbi:DNA topoisomerase, related, partial [Eimeria tenella]